MSRTAYLLAAATEVAVPVSSSSTISLVFRLVQFGFRGEHQPVVEHRMRDVLHVVRSNEVAAFRRAECLRRPDQGDALA